jgi:hypothetical protein
MINEAAGKRNESVVHDAGGASISQCGQAHAITSWESVFSLVSSKLGAADHISQEGLQLVGLGFDFFR